MSRIYGLTIDRVDNLPGIVAAIKQLPVRPTLRIVCDPGEDPKNYMAACRALSPIADLMISPVDSAALGAGYYKRVSDYQLIFQSYLGKMNGFATYFEVGNEVNGDWLGGNVRNKVDAALKLCQFYNKKSVITYYLDGNDPYQMTNWAIDAKLQSDFALVSYYPNTSLGKFVDLTTVMTFLKRFAPKVGFGEYGCEDADGNDNSTPQDRMNMITHFENLAMEDPAYIGGGFYWDFASHIEELVPIYQKLWATKGESSPQ